MSKSTIPDLSMHEEIANTYFKVLSGKKMRKKRLSTKALWFIIALAAISVLAAAIFLNNSRMEIGVRPSSGSAATASTAADNKTILDKDIFLIEGSRPNGDLIMSLTFKGDAASFSRIGSDSLVLCGRSGSGWANCMVELKRPVDLERFDLRYSASGQRGNEYIAIILIDSDNRSYRMGSDMRTSLKRDYQTYMVDFGSLGGVIDLSRVSAIGFEFGSLTVGNSAITTIFLKDISLTKSERMK